MTRKRFKYELGQMVTHKAQISSYTKFMVLSRAFIESKEHTDEVYWVTTVSHDTKNTIMGVEIYKNVTDEVEVFT